jgi:hypothetical protein
MSRPDVEFSWDIYDSRQWMVKKALVRMQILAICLDDKKVVTLRAE